MNMNLLEDNIDLVVYMLDCVSNYDMTNNINNKIEYLSDITKHIQLVKDFIDSCEDSRMFRKVDVNDILELTKVLEIMKSLYYLHF